MPAVEAAEFDADLDAAPNLDAAAAPARQRARSVRTAGKSDEDAAAIIAARKQRKADMDKARGIRTKEAKKAADAARYAALTPPEKTTRQQRAYILTHVGENPVHKTQPAAAQRHGIAAHAPPPLVIKASNILGARRVLVENVHVEQHVELEEDPDEPTCFANMLAALGRYKATTTEARSRQKYVADVLASFVWITGLDKAAVQNMDDVSPVFRGADASIAKLEDSRMLRKQQNKAKGEIMAVNSIKGRFQAMLILVDHWPALKLSAAVKDKWSAAFQKYKDASIEAAESRDKGKAIAMSEVLRRVLDRFGRASMEYVYVLLFSECPVRDDVGALHIVNYDDAATDEAVNYLILRHRGEGGKMAVLLNVYKTRVKYGQKTYVLSDGVAKVIRDYYSKHPDNLYLFCKPKSKGLLPFAKQPTLAEAAAGKEEGGMSPFVAKFLREALPVADHDLLKNAAINFLRKSFASSSPLPVATAAKMMCHALVTHKKTYMLPLRADPDDADDE